MACVLRMVSTSPWLSKSQPMSILIQNIFNQRKFHLTNLVFDAPKLMNLRLDEFISERNNFKEDINMLDVKSRLEKPIPIDLESRNEYRYNFVHLIYSIKKEEDIDLAFDVIKKQKNLLLDLKEKRLPNYFAKLLFVMNKTDRLTELLNDQELGKLFKNKTCVGLSMLGLIREKRYSEAMEVFLKFLRDYVTKGQSVMLIKDLVGQFSWLAYKMNSNESMKALDDTIQMLVSSNCTFINSTIHNDMCMLCIKQNRPEVAMRILKRTQHPISLNLSVIINSQLDQLKEAFTYLELIVDLKFNKDKLSKHMTLAQDTLAYLKEAIDRNTDNNSDLYHQKLQDIEAKLSMLNLVNPLSLDSLIEAERLRANIQIRKKAEERVTNNSNEISVNRPNRMLNTNIGSDTFNEAYQYFNKKNFSEVLNIFERLLLNLNTNGAKDLPAQALDILSLSIKNDKIGSAIQIKRILELMTERTSSKWPINSIIDIYLRFTQIDPLYSLEFLAGNDTDFQKKYPCIHNNLLCVGLALIDQIDEALNRIESIMSTDLDNSKCQGVIFPKTIQILQAVVMNSHENELKNRFIEILIRMTNEKRMTDFDMSDLNLSNEKFQKHKNVKKDYF